MPLFRSKGYSLPAFRLGPLAAVVLLGLAVVGLVALAVFEPRPPLKQYEVPVPNERFSR